MVEADLIADSQAVTRGERLKMVRETLNLSQKEFAQRLNTDQSSLSAIESGRRNLGNRLANAISLEFNLNQDWLYSGLGEMFTRIHAVQDQSVGYRIRPNKVGAIPYYDIDVSASRLSFFSDISSETPSAFFEIPFLEDCDFAIKVYGDSMYPKFNNGDVIVCKEVSHWANYMVYGEVYLVITREERMVKYVRKSSKPGHWLMASENRHHDEFDLPISEILKVYSVKGKIQRNAI